MKKGPLVACGPMIRGMEKFYGMALAPFLLLGMRLLAIPFTRCVQRMKDCAFKRELLRRYG